MGVAPKFETYSALSGPNVVGVHKDASVIGKTEFDIS